MSIIDILTQDVFLYIIEFLSDHERRLFISICKGTLELQSKVMYEEFHKYFKIKNTSYISNFKRLIYIGPKDKPICKSVNKSTKYIITSTKYKIHHGVTNLKFEFAFNESFEHIPGFIPDTVTHLTFGNKFNKSIRNCIPSSVKYLRFGTDFNQNIRNCIPYGVEHLTLEYGFTNTIHDSVPKSVTHLILYCDYDQSKQGAIHFGVTHLTFGGNIECITTDCIPTSVVNLIIVGNINPINMKNVIPASVTHLEFGIWFNQSIKGYIPNSVTHLKFGKYFDQSIDNCIPSSISHLKLNSNNDIPKTIRYLSLGPHFNISILTQMKLKRITHLKLDMLYNPDIVKIIPKNIKYLRFK